MNRIIAQSRFEADSRRAALAAGRDDATITAMTYLSASKITVVTKAQLLRALAGFGEQP